MNIQLSTTFILACMFCIGTVHASQDYHKIELHKDWTMTVTQGAPQVKSIIGKQYNITVPSTLHLNLEKYGIIEDPYFRDNLRKMDYLSMSYVTFATKIHIVQSQKKYSRAKLTFEGIDTYSEIYFNDVKIGSTNNAFLKYEYDVEKLLKQGSNTLQVRLSPTRPVDQKGQTQNRMPFQYAHTRKAAYQYSWDWAPKMNTMGVWLPVTLTLFEEAKFNYVWVRDRTLTPSKAVVNFVVVLDSYDSDFKSNQLELNIKRLDSGEGKRVGLSSKHTSTDFTIANPELWWPNGIGQPHVYQFELELFSGKFKLDSKKIVYGLRTVSLNEQGTNFQISVNGYPVYCKGANWVPPDMMYPRVINPEFKAPTSIKGLLQDAKLANFNMLRVWGGGQYESDQFYEVASRLGIMIFQDFMFSDSIYPATDAFLNNVQDEIVQQVRRLRNYPCMTLWSGNNQILQGIRSWGWGSANYKENYKKLFENLIPQILKMQSSTLPYIPSSPSKGIGNGGFQGGGDIHFWGVWAAGSPFSSYESAIGGFNSEFGTQSIPVWASVKQFTSPEDRSYQSKVMLFHEKHNSMFRTLQSYMTQNAHRSVNFEMECYSSGLVQAAGIEIAIRAQRISKPKSWGTLYWQYNDAWPVVSWSSMDYYGRWKPLLFTAKTLYRDVILVFHPQSKRLFAINDRLTLMDVVYKVDVMLLNGSIMYSDEGRLTLQANEAKHMKDKEIPSSSYKGQEDSVVIMTEIRYGQAEDETTRVTSYLVPYKGLKLEDAELIVRYLAARNQIEFNSSAVIKSLFISHDKLDLKLSDNYFDVLPNRLVRVKVLGGVDLGKIKNGMVYKSYRQVYQSEPLRVKVISEQ